MADEKKEEEKKKEPKTTSAPSTIRRKRKKGAAHAVKIPQGEYSIHELFVPAIVSRMAALEHKLKQDFQHSCY